MGEELSQLRGSDELANIGPRPLNATEAFRLTEGKHVIQDLIMARVLEAFAKNQTQLPPCIIIKENHTTVYRYGDGEKEDPYDRTHRVTLHPEQGGISVDGCTNESYFEKQIETHWKLGRSDDGLVLKCSTSGSPHFEDIMYEFSAALSNTAFEYKWTFYLLDGKTSSDCFYSTANVESGTPAEFAERTSGVETSNESPNKYWTMTSNPDGTRDLSFFTQTAADVQEPLITLHETVSFDRMNNTQTYSYEHTYHGPRIPKDAIHLAHHSVTLDAYGRITHMTVAWEKNGLTKASHESWTVNYSPTVELETY